MECPYKCKKLLKLLVALFSYVDGLQFHITAILLDGISEEAYDESYVKCKGQYGMCVMIGLQVLWHGTVSDYFCRFYKFFDHVSGVQSKDKIELFNRFKPNVNCVYHLL